MTLLYIQFLCRRGDKKMPSEQLTDNSDCQVTSDPLFTVKFSLLTALVLLDVSKQLVEADLAAGLFIDLLDDYGAVQAVAAVF